MKTLSERIDSLRAMAKDMHLDTERGDHRLLLEMLSLMNDMAKQIEKGQKERDDLYGFVEQLDNSLADLEDAVYEPDDEDDAPRPSAMSDDHEEDDDLIRYACPSCGTPMTFRVSAIDLDELPKCTHCGQLLFPDLDDDQPTSAD